MGTFLKIVDTTAFVDTIVDTIVDTTAMLLVFFLKHLLFQWDGGIARFAVCFGEEEGPQPSRDHCIKLYRG